MNGVERTDEAQRLWRVVSFECGLCDLYLVRLWAIKENKKNSLV